MGKKSKRRTCKRSQKKAQQGASTRENKAAPGTVDVGFRMDCKLSVENESEYLSNENFSQHLKPAVSCTGHQHDSKKSNENSLDTGEYEDEFIEFMLWTLCENKADLTPKKFAKSAPRLAMKLIASDISIQDILQRRNVMLEKIEEEIQEIESEYIDLLKLEVTFNDQDWKKEFLCHMIKNKISQSFHLACGRQKEKIVVLQKYYMHATASEEFLKENVYAQMNLIFVLSHFEEMHRCWNCNQLHECQVEHWKAGRHKEYCEDLGRIWSKYTTRKRRVGKAIRKQRVYTKPIIVDGIEKECFLPPCEPIDFLVCRNRLQNFNNAASSSMDTYYKNIAILACAGKHLLFGDETISSELENKIRLGYENVISEFDPKSLRKDEVFAMNSIAEALLDKDNDLARRKDVPNTSSDFSVERFLTLYIFIGSISGGKHLGKKLCDQIPYRNIDKFDIETQFLHDLKDAHEKNK
ncbi:predicted protein [Chaetoceros tenuissimus]|uniref:Uncharacterized protein n=1 Tax=Chaetoceros tenuissimus TaxID=426638 RepID=A0AAD3CNA4_9STRA|nr:predicted protein [Chaetoceros tenuissimus]